jgi:hypothetical protein
MSRVPVLLNPRSPMINFTDTRPLHVSPPGYALVHVTANFPKTAALYSFRRGFGILIPISPPG